MLNKDPGYVTVSAKKKQYYRVTATIYSFANLNDEKKIRKRAKKVFLKLFSKLFLIAYTKRNKQYATFLSRFWFFKLFDFA